MNTRTSIVVFINLPGSGETAASPEEVAGAVPFAGTPATLCATAAVVLGSTTAGAALTGAAVDTPVNLVSKAA